MLLEGRTSMYVMASVIPEFSLQYSEKPYFPTIC